MTTRTVVLLHFAEPVSTFKPHDAMGELADLGVVAGITMPEVADAFTGLGRDFVPASTRGLTAADQADGDTLLTRNCTVQVLTTIRAGSAAAWPRALVVRGLGGSSAERVSFGLEVDEVAVPADHLELRWYWEDEAGAQQSPVSGGTFKAPATDDEFLLLTATRRWVSIDQVVVRYYVNEHLIGEVDTTATGVSGSGSIGGGTTGSTSIGARKAAGVWGSFWDGIIDEVKVTDYEMSPEEVRATWERLTRHQPSGVAQVTALAPPGSKWGEDPSQNRGRLMRIAGESSGVVVARAEELRENFLAQNAYHEEIQRWEDLVGISAKPRDWLDRRRERVVANLSRDNGYAVPQLQDVLAEPLDLDASDIEIMEFTNRIDEAFTTLEAERWYVEAGTNGTIQATAGELEFDIDAGESYQYDGTTLLPRRAMTSISSNEGRMVALIKLDNITSLGLTALAGLYLFNWRTKNSLWWGVKNDGGTQKIGYTKLQGGVLSAFVTVLDPAPAAPIWLRAIKDADVAGRYSLGYSTTGPETGFTNATVNDLLDDPEWAGAALHSTAVVAASASVFFDDFVLIAPKGTRPFKWYAYRDPLLAGVPDMLGANALIRRMKPAYTHGAAITSKSLLCDNEASGCDRGPMGGL
jgi:hypothetical protein